MSDHDRVSAAENLKVTQRMIDAGVTELWNSHLVEPLDDANRRVVRRIYAAMRRLEPED
jgi:hypothetical protein